MLSIQELKKHGIRLSGRRGQRLVVDENVLSKIIESAELRPDDVVFEIGTGIGNLTSLLAPKVRKVITVENDRRLLNLAKSRLPHKNIEFILGDALKIEWPKFNKLIANIPYQISSKITFCLLERDFDLAVLLYQKEFAERLVALPGSGEYGRLTVSFYYRALAEILMEVPPEAFYPPPKVFSAIVRIKPRKPPFVVLNEKMFFQTVTSLFQHRRQLTKNALYHSFHMLFSDSKLKKTGKREFINKILPKELAETRVVDLTPEQIGEISNRLTRAEI